MQILDTNFLFWILVLKWTLEWFGERDLLAIYSCLSKSLFCNIIWSSTFSKQFQKSVRHISFVCVPRIWLIMLWSLNVWVHGLWTPNEGMYKSKKYEKLGWCGRQNMLRAYLKILGWELIYWHAVKEISSPGVRSPCLSGNFKMHPKI